MNDKQEQIEQLRQQIKFAHAKWLELEEAEKAIRTELPKAAQHYHSLCDKLARLTRPDAAKHRRDGELAYLEQQLAYLKGGVA